MKKLYIFESVGLTVQPTPKDFRFASFKAPYLIIGNGYINIPHGYAWDGCSPKKIIKDLLVGTPDGAPGFDGKPKTYYASMIHDALYQYKSSVPVTRAQADKLFYDMLLEADFYWAKTYYRAVRLFGGLMGKWKYE